MKRAATLLTAMLSATVFFGGCIQLPTEVSAVVDTRPRLSFEAPAYADTENWQVFVDDLFVGNVSQFIRGQSALRVLPGSHTVRVVRPGLAPIEERIYVGDGVAKTITIN